MIKREVYGKMIKYYRPDAQIVEYINGKIQLTKELQKIGESEQIPKEIEKKRRL
jgi:hypothetical protein